MFNKIFNIAKANQEIESLTTKVEDLTGLNEQLSKEIESLKQIQASVSLGAQDWVAEKEALVKGHEEAIKDIDAKHTLAISNLEKTVADVKASAGKQAADIVASLGVEPEAVKVSNEEILAKQTNARWKITDHLKRFSKTI